MVTQNTSYIKERKKQYKAVEMTPTKHEEKKQDSNRKGYVNMVADEGYMVYHIKSNLVIVLVQCRNIQDGTDRTYRLQSLTQPGYYDYFRTFTLSHISLSL